MSAPPSSHLPPLPHAGASQPRTSSSRWRTVLVFALFAGIGALVGGLMSDRLVASPVLEQWTLAQTLLLAAALPIGLLLIVAVHEGGHTAAGALTGFRLQHLSVGPLKLQRTPRGWRGSRSQHGFFEGMSHSVPGTAVAEQEWLRALTTESESG